jgi:transposase
MPAKRRKKDSKRLKPYHGFRARTGEQTLCSWTVGAVPIVNRFLDRMKLEEILQRHLPPDDRRLKVPTTKGLLLLIRNVLLSREPMYGLGEWAERYAPDLLGMTTGQLGKLNDDRIGRCLDRLFEAATPQLIMDVVRHVIQEFAVGLDELHNDSTTVSFYGAYDDASEEGRRRGRATPAITFGHSKARRPDLKQLLYILTVTEDGGVPVYFTTASGNVTDDTTHRATWDLMCELVGNVDFLYVADCKLATSENLKYIASHGGRFISILPRTRKEDKTFRQHLLKDPDAIPWEHVYDVHNDEELVDRLYVYGAKSTSQEGFRLLWFHSLRKEQRDAASRRRVIERTLKELGELRERLESPNTRFRKRAQVEEAVQEILTNRGGEAWVRVSIEEMEQETFQQATRGRPGKDTKYVRKVRTRFTLSMEIDQDKVLESQTTDGVFPLITNDREMTPEDVLRAYKRQPLIEKRFSQFKTDFEVAPVCLKEVSRIQALLCIYFFALVVQTLLERHVRHAMADANEQALPLYPEGRACRAPTARRVFDVFESVQRHELKRDGEVETFVTELTSVQRDLLALLRLDHRSFGR